MVPHCLLVEIHILGIGRAVAQHLRELQHVVGVARLRTVQLINIAIGIGLGQEVLVHGVTTDAHGAVPCHVRPEVLSSTGVVVRLSILHCPFTNPFHTDVFRHLGVGMFVVEEGGVETLHAVEHRIVRIALGCR